MSYDGINEEANKSEKGGKVVDIMAIDAAEKANIGSGKFIDNPINAKRLAGEDSKMAHDISSESIAGPQDAVVPAKSSDVVTGPLMGMSKAVPQQMDNAGPEDGIEDAKTAIDFDGKMGKAKGIPSAVGVPQQTDEGKDGI